METHVIEVTGISDELLRLLDERVRQKGGDRSSLIRELIQKELQGTPRSRRKTNRPHAEMSFEEILRPVHRQVEESGITDEELDRMFEEARAQVRSERKQSRSRG
jgi:metal-responsive CopG/Arc/MetJ family transcriptional regulator